MDMDHVSVIAMFDHMQAQKGVEASNELGMSALAAQGGDKQIKKTMQDLASSEDPESASTGGLKEFKELLKRV